MNTHNKPSHTPEKQEHAHHNRTEASHNSSRDHESRAQETAHDKVKEEEKAREKVESLSLSVEEHKAIEETNPSREGRNNPPHHYLTNKVKNGVFHQSIENIQTHLSPTENKFSNLIHNDSVEKISEVGAKTIARPNAILGGGIIMLVGGGFSLFMSKKYGFEIPLSVFLSLYFIGFIVAITLDVVAKKLIIRKKAKHTH